MKTKLFTSMITSIFLVVFLIGVVSGASLAQWDLNSNLNPTSNINVEALAFEAGSGVNSPTAGTNGAFTSGWSNLSSIQQNDYVLITIKPKTGYSLTINNLDFEDMRSPQGPNSYDLMWVKGSSTSNIFSGNLFGTFNPLDGNSTPRNLTLNSVTVSDSEVFAVSWFGYDANASSGTLTLDDIIISGIVTQTTTPPTTNLPLELSELLNDSEVIRNRGDHLRLTIDDITTVNGFGDDEDYWYPFDEIEIDFEVEYRGDDEFDGDFYWGVYNVDQDRWVIDDKQSLRVKEREEETITVTFKLDRLKYLKDSGNFQIYMWVLGEDEEFDDDNETFQYLSQEIEIITDDEFVLLDNIEFIPETGRCGDLIQITADVWNIGDRDQDDVSVVISNQDFGIRERIVIGDIDDYDSEQFIYSFEIPEDADEKRYIFTFEVYDEDNDIYETDEDEDLSRITRTFDVAGGCSISGVVNLIISANLESGGKAGEELIVKSTINNLENARVIVSIEAENHQSWADLISVSPSTAILEAGDSKEVIFRFNVNKDISGERTFNIIATPENAQSVTQPVEVSIEKSSLLNLEENLVIYILAGLIAVVILLIIIVLIVRAVRR